MTGNATVPAQEAEKIAKNDVTVGVYLATRLRQLGVDCLFGMPGDFNLILLDDMLSDAEFRWVGSTNELNAAYAADGYARVRGFGALVTTYGVGELSALNGIAGAYAESVPLVQITGAPSSTTAAAGALTHHSLMDGDFAHFERAYREVTAAAETLTAAKAGEQIDRVLALAIQESLPVYLSVPIDVASTRIPAHRLAEPLPAPSSDPVSLSRFTAALASHLTPHQKVTVLAGHLARRRQLQPYLRRLADTGRADIATLVNAKGMLDEGHPASLGTYIGAFTHDERTRQGVEKGQQLVLVGALFSDLVSGVFTHEIDEEEAVVLDLHQARIGKNTFENVDLTDTCAVLTELVERMESHPLSARTELMAVTPPLAPKSVTARSGVLTQVDFWSCIQDHISPDTVLLADVGTAFYGAAELRLPADCEMVGQPMWSSIGYTLPALLGVQLAAPDKRSVLLIGDGAAQLTVQELSVILHERLTPVIILLNNAGYTVERAIRSPDAVYHDITSWDWTAIAVALGQEERVLAVTARSAEELTAALRSERQESERALFIEAVLGRDDIPPLLQKITAAVGRAQG